MNDDKKAREFLASQPYMVVAVVLDDNSPWAVPVRIQRWDDKKFEWDSALNTEHSKAIAKRPTMAITIFQKFENSQIGFYAKGKGELIDEFKPGFGRYRFTVETCWINDETFKKRQVNL